MGKDLFTNIGAQVKSVIANASANSGAPSLITAAGTGDATKVLGETIDCLGYNSCEVAVCGLAALTATKTLTIALELQESADGSTWDTAEAIYAAATVATGDTGGSNETFDTEDAIDLSGRKRYIRFNVTPDLNATSTDTALFVATALLGGPHRAPAS